MKVEHDYENLSNYSDRTLTITATDPLGLSVEKSIEYEIIDVDEGTNIPDDTEEGPILNFISNNSIIDNYNSLPYWYINSENNLEYVHEEINVQIIIDQSDFLTASNTVYTNGDMVFQWGDDAIAPSQVNFETLSNGLRLVWAVDNWKNIQDGTLIVILICFIEFLTQKMEVFLLMKFK